MTNLPISSPTPMPRETLYSYLARLAAAWRTDVPSLAYDMGAPFKRLLAQDQEAIETVAEWANLPPDVMVALLSWTGVREGNVRMRFRGELYVSRALRNPLMRGCPACLREDSTGAVGPAYAAMAMRGDWQFREMMLCVRHGHPLVPLWQANSLKDRFDIGARLREIEADVLTGSLDQSVQVPSAYDRWLHRRLENGRDDSWLSDHSVFVVTALCRMVGQALLKDKARDEGTVPGIAHAAGFDAVVAGEEALRATLDRIAARATGASDEPGRVFGLLYKKLSHDYRSEPGFELFRKILRECILDHWPIARGETVLGEALPQRRVHSLTTAALETGTGAKVLEHFLIDVGALRADDSRPKSRRLFDAQAYEGLLAEIPTLVGPIAMRTAMGATKKELTALAEAGVLNPRIKVETVRNPWRVADGLDLVAELSAGADAVKKHDKDWERLLLAFRRSRAPLQELIQAIRDRRLKVGQRDGVPGFHGIVVPKIEVDIIAAPFRKAGNIVIEEVPGSMAALKFARSVGLRDGGSFHSMIEAGHVPASQIVSPRTGRLQYRMTPEDMAAFHYRFATLTTLSAETGQHRNTLKGMLSARRITPFSPDGQNFGAVYLRADVATVTG